VPVTLKDIAKRFRFFITTISRRLLDLSYPMTIQVFNALMAPRANGAIQESHPYHTSIS
jgi:hypothetical protein